MALTLSKIYQVGCVYVVVVSDAPADKTSLTGCGIPGSGVVEVM
jgi:hypothetical protein